MKHRRHNAGRARADRHRDHVLFQPLVIADAGIAACGNNIDEILLGDDFEADIRISS